MAKHSRPKVIDSLTAVLPMLNEQKAQIVRCRLKGRADMALLPYKALQPVLHKVVTDFGSLVALRYDLLDQMLKEAKMKMKCVVLDMDSRPKPKKAGKVRKPKTARSAKASKKTRKAKGPKAARKSAAKKAKKVKKAKKAKKVKKAKRPGRAGKPAGTGRSK